MSVRGRRHKLIRRIIVTVAAALDETPLALREVRRTGNVPLLARLNLNGRASRLLTLEPYGSDRLSN